PAGSVPPSHTARNEPSPDFCLRCPSWAAGTVRDSAQARKMRGARRSARVRRFMVRRSMLTGIRRPQYFIELAAVGIVYFAVATLSPAGYAAAASFWAIWMTWWLGDLAGALVVTPVLVLWSARPALARDELLRSAAIMATTIAVGILAFSPLFEQTANRGALA